MVTVNNECILCYWGYAPLMMWWIVKSCPKWGLSGRNMNQMLHVGFFVEFNFLIQRNNFNVENIFETIWAPFFIKMVNGYYDLIQFWVVFHFTSWTDVYGGFSSVMLEIDSLETKLIEVFFCMCLNFRSTLKMLNLIKLRRGHFW